MIGSTECRGCMVLIGIAELKQGSRAASSRARLRWVVRRLPRGIDSLYAKGAAKFLPFLWGGELLGGAAAPPPAGACTHRAHKLFSSPRRKAQSAERECRTQRRVEQPTIGPFAFFLPHFSSSPLPHFVPSIESRESFMFRHRGGATSFAAAERPEHLFRSTASSTFLSLRASHRQSVREQGKDERERSLPPSQGDSRRGARAK